MSADAPQISVIVPVFNVATHVGACIRSLRAQTWTNFEALVVDDGSTDGSGELAHREFGDDPRFRLIRQENRGLSGARNTGLMNARGAFIAFLDSDDRFAPRFLERMRDALIADGSDWAACAINLCFPDGQEILHSAIHGAPEPQPGTARVVTFDDCREVVRHFPSAWNKLYRRELIADTRFPEGTWYEDHEFFWSLVARCPRLSYLPEPLYLHSRDRPNQITGVDDDRVFEQFAVLDRLAGLIRSAGLAHVDEGFARIASRLVHERTEVVRDPERRRRFLSEAAALFARHGISYSPEWDRDIGHAPGLMMKGVLPLSVVLRDCGEAGEDLRATLGALEAQGMVDFELLVPDPQQAGLPPEGGFLANGARVVPLPPRKQGLAGTLERTLDTARGRYLVLLQPGDQPSAHCFKVWINAMERHGGSLGFSGFEQVTWGAGSYNPGITRPAPFGGDLAKIEPSGGVVTLTPERALRLNPVLAALVVRRDLYVKAGLPQALTGCPESLAAQMLMLLLAFAAGTAVYCPIPSVTVSSRPWPGATPFALARAIRSSQRPRPLTALPAGWERVIFARGVQAGLFATSARGQRLLQITAAAIAARVYPTVPVTELPADSDISPYLRRALGNSTQSDRQD